MQQARLSQLWYVPVSVSLKLNTLGNVPALNGFCAKVGVVSEQGGCEKATDRLTSHNRKKPSGAII